MIGEIRQLHIVFVTSVVVLWGVAHATGGEERSRIPTGSPVVFISVDTLRSDRLPAYGYEGVDTPAIDRLRRDGILFKRAYTHVPLTLPAHTSLLTGLLPPEHGVRDNLGYTVDSTTAPLLQQVLRRHGYETGAAVSAYVLRRSTGLDEGFDFYQDDVEFGSVPGVQAIQRPGMKTLRAVRPWLRSVAEKPFFLFFHIFEPHAPYEPPDHLARRYSSPYDGEVAAADEVVAALLADLDELGVYGRALIIFFSDHGEGLGDHGEAEHGIFLYRSTLQVPLIMKLPGARRAGEAVSHPVQLIDVYPTVLSALGLPFGNDLEGMPLLAPLRLQTGDRPVFAETLFPRFHFGWSDLAALIIGPHHYIEAPQPELYNLVRDPAEVDNLIGSKPDLESEFRTALGRFDREFAAPQEVDPLTRQRLEALGYVGRASSAGDDALPDPKTRVGTLAKIQRAYQSYSEGDYASAANAFEEIVTENPRIEDAWEYLALAQLGLGRVDDAVLTYEAAVERLSSSSRLSLRLAMLLHRLGRLEEAYVQANLAIPYDAAAAHVLLARIALQRDDLEEAELEAREALSDGDRRLAPRLLLADICIARGNSGEAIDLLAKSLADGISDEPLRAKLATIHLWIGESDEAEALLRGYEETDDLEILVAYAKLEMIRQRWGDARVWLERALKVDPENPLVKITLGMVALNEGRSNEARRFLEEGVAGAPASFEGWRALGDACARQRDVDAAIAAWERAHQINPGAVELLFNLGLAHAQAGNLEKAINLFEDFAAQVEAGPKRERALAMAQRLRQRAAGEHQPAPLTTSRP
jgi:arylsulfatase A-like enzyme/predicted Zn-dependent protease